jgi:hypothetical protein
MDGRRIDGETTTWANAQRDYNGYHMNHPKATKFLYPHCWDEDQIALDRLLAAIRKK